MASLSAPDITENADFGWKQSATQTEVMQNFTADVGGMYTRQQIITAMGRWNIPQVYQGATFRGLPLVCFDQDARQNRELPNVWEISCIFRSIQWITQQVANPYQRPALWATGTYKLQETPTVDFDGKPVATTAGEQISYTYQRSYPSYTVTKKLQDYPVGLASARDYVNGSTVVILGVEYPAYTLFMPDITISELQYETNASGQFPFFDFSATIYAKTDKNPVTGQTIGWRNLLRNAGYHERVCTNPTTRNPKWTITNNQPIQINTPARKRKYALQAIALGPKGNLHFPSTPVLLDPNGRAFRQKMPGDTALTGNTGPILALQNSQDTPASQAITLQQWNAAVQEFRFYNIIDFSKLVPLQ